MYEMIKNRAFARMNFFAGILAEKYLDRQFMRVLTFLFYIY